MENPKCLLCGGAIERGYRTAVLDELRYLVELRDAVEWERECEEFDPLFNMFNFPFTPKSWLARHSESYRTKQNAHADVDRLLTQATPSTAQR